MVFGTFKYLHATLEYFRVTLEYTLIESLRSEVTVVFYTFEYLRVALE